MANSININGTEYRIEGDDLATEATLRSLVAAMNRLASASARSGGGSSNAGGGAADAGAALNQGLDEVAGNLDDMSGSVIRMNTQNNEIIRLQGGTAKGFNILGGAAKALGGAFKLVQGAFMIGVAIVSAAFGAVDKMADTVKEMNASGIRFQGGFAELAAAAGSAGLSVEELGRLMTQNHAAVARFGGGNMNEGAKRLTAFSRELVFGKAKLAGLGIGVSEAAQYLADYADIQQNLTHQDITRARAGETAADVQKRVTASTADYVSDLDSLARSTGKTREEMNKMMADFAKNPDFTATLDMLGLAGEEKNSVMKFATMLQGLPGGETLVSAFGDLLQFGTMTGDTAAAFATVGPQLQNTFTGIADKLKSGAITEEQARDEMANAMGDNAEQISKTLGAIPQAQRTQAQKDLLMAANAAKANKAAREGEVIEFMKTAAGRNKTFAEAEKAMNDQRSAELESQKQLQDIKTKFGGMFESLILKIFGSKVFLTLFDKITTGFQTLADFIYSAIKKVDPYIAKFDTVVMPIVNKMIKFFSDVFGKVSEILGKIDITSALSILGEIFDQILTFANTVVNAIDFKMIGDIFTQVFGTVSDVLQNLWGRVKDIFSKQEGGMGGTLAKLGEALGKIVNALGKVIKVVVKVFKLLYDWVLQPIMDILGPIIGTIVNALVGVIDIFGSLADYWTTLIDFFMGDASFSEVFDKFMAVWTSIGNYLINGLKDWGKMLMSPFVSIYNHWVRIFNTVGDFVKNVFGGFDIGVILTKVTDSIKNVFAGIAKWWKEFSFMDMLNSITDAIKGLFSSIGNYIKDKLNPLNWFKKDKKGAAAAPPPKDLSKSTIPAEINTIPEGQRTPIQNRILEVQKNPMAMLKPLPAAPTTPAATGAPAAATALAKPAAGVGKVVNTDDLVKKISAQIDMMTQVLMAIEKQGEEKPGMVSGAFSSLTKKAAALGLP